MKIKIISAKLFSILMSVSILCGIFFSLPTLADSTTDKNQTFTMSVLTDNETAEKHASNALVTAEYSALTWSGDFKYSYPYTSNGIYTNAAGEKQTVAERLTDGNTSDHNYGDDKNSTRPAGSAVAVAKSNTVENAGFRVRFKMQYVYEISSFLIGWADQAPVKSYNIYVTDDPTVTTYAQLCSEENKVAYITGETVGTLNRLITLDKPVTALYICFEFTEFSIAKNYQGGAWTGVLLTELAAYGKRLVTGFTADDTVTDAYITEHYNDPERIKDISAFYVENCNFNSDSDSEKLSLLTDGKTDAPLRVTVENSDKPQFTAELGSIYIINSLLLALSEKSLAAEYSVYLSVDKEILYDDDNIVALYTYEEGNKTPVLFTFENEYFAKYIGIQFDKTASEDGINFIELLETAVYGIKTPDDFNVRTSVSDKTLNADFVIENHKNNLLTSGILSLAKSTVTGDGYYLAYGEGGNYPRSLNMLCDGQVALDGFTHKEPGDTLNFRQYTSGPGITKFRLQLDLGLFDCTIESVLIYGLKDNEIGGYNIYISDTKENLFEKENWVALYNNNDTSEVQQIVFNQKLKGKYVGFEVTVKNLNKAEASKSYNEQYIYLKEIAVYGERDQSQIPKPVYEYTVLEDIVTQEYVSTNHKYNLIRYARSTNTYDDGTDYKIKQFTSKVTDGTVYDDSTHYTGENVEEVFTPFRATFSLGQTVSIDKIMFASFYHSTIDFSTQIYEIYISDTLDDLYEPENLSVFQNNYGKWRAGQSEKHTGANQVFVFTGNKPIGRYVGFRIILPNAGQDMRIRIEQLGVYSDGVTPVDPVYIKTVTDQSTGIQVALKKLEYEDEFNRFESLSIEHYTPSSEIISKASSYYLNFKGIGYKVSLKDSQGRILTEEDLEGRALEISIPYTYSDNDGKLYVCEADGNELKNCPALIEKNRVVFTTKSLNPIALFEDLFEYGSANSHLLIWDPVYELSLKASKNNDEYNYDNYDNYNYDIDTDGETEINESPDDSTMSKPKKVKKIITKRVVNKNNSLFTSPWFWIIMAVVLFAAAGAVVLLIFKRKKRKINV